MQDIQKDIALGKAVSKTLLLSGIPKPKHMAHVAKVLNISHDGAHKKLSGKIRWDLKQLMAVAESVDAKMSDLFEFYENHDREIFDATWTTTGHDFLCKVYRSKSNTEESSLAAVQLDGRWMILERSKVAESVLSENSYSIDKLYVYPEQIKKKKVNIAILDDDPSITSNLTEIIESESYSTTPFNNINSMIDTVKEDCYDAYILDWSVNDESALRLIKYIRVGLKSDAMIIILTGKLSTIGDDEIALAIHDYDIMGPYEKPIKAGVITSILDKSFNR